MRGHPYKLLKQKCRTCLRKHFSLSYKQQTLCCQLNNSAATITAGMFKIIVLPSHSCGGTLQSCHCEDANCFVTYLFAKMALLPSQVCPG